MLSGSSPSGLPCMSNHTAPNLSAHEVVLGAKSEGRVPNNSILENTQAGTEGCSHSLTFPAVKERRGKKTPLLSAKNCCPANKEK